MNLARKLARFRDSGQFSELVSLIEERKRFILTTNLYGSSKFLLAVLLFEELDRTILVLVNSEENRRRVTEDLRSLLDDDRILSIPPLALRRLDEDLPHLEIEEQRMAALSSLLNGKKAIAVVPALSASQRLIFPRVLRDLLIEINVGEPFDMSDFVRRLDNLGYVREDVVVEVGTYSRRGGIVDLFGIRMVEPVRIEFGEDTIVSLREFDPATQRSVRTIDRVTVIPIEERGGGPPESPIFDYLPQHTLVLVDEYPDFMKRVDELGAQLGNEQCLLGADGMNACLREFQTVGMSSLHVHEGGEETHSLRFATREPVPVNRKFTGFLEALEKHKQEGYQVFLLCDNEGQEERFRELLGTHEDDLELVQGSLEEGFLAGDVGMAVYTDHEIFKRPRRIRYLREHTGAAPVESFTSIKPGDYLVHINYGIARYEGIKRISVGEGEIECLSLAYDGGDRVYVPVDRLSLVEKYSTEDVAPPALDRLGSKKWERLKKRTKDSIKVMAKELLDLYAARKVIRGFAYSPDTPWQMELESSFIYEDTPDQSKAAQEVKRDMESEAPMDRLVCGDVGYGKTEIAIRAAFKAVQDGKQVAVLVPTTVLAQQHLMTFRSRLEMFPLKIEMLSRFLTSREQNKVLKAVGEGAVDILIGTHRLLSRDVRFRDLGLMIIDEEHRFGVKQKERLKKMRKNVDVLTLSATPIPRTLYLSLMGMRDMSVIETPPRDRMPIATYVTRWNDELIRGAVMREVDRGGQVYFIHNRIASIEAMNKKIKKLLPECTIEIAHGRMHERKLEQVMLSFLKGEVDILLSTMIVESGLDISNANTLIVDRADMFGLAQLYQLRGRVGRSYRKASAYLLIPPKHSLDMGARKRLRVLEEYTDLGSGYWIALKDLELRGAGNVLGPQQHGFISTMGFDTYYRLLDEAIREMKGEEKEEKEPVEIHAGIEAYLPDEYIGSSDQKLSLYRKLSGVENTRSLHVMKAEIVDRFGPLPAVAWNLLKLLEVKIYATDLGIQSISVRGNRASITFREGHPHSMDRWNEVLERRGYGLIASWDGRSKFNLVSRGSLDALESVKKVLQEVSL